MKLNLNRVLRARLGTSSGVAATASGGGLVFGLGWALVVAGVATTAFFLLLYNVDH